MSGGKPSRAFFFVGAAGCIINIIASTMGVFYNVSIVDVYPYVMESPFYFLGIAAASLLTVGVILAAIGYLGIRRNYGYSLGVAAFVFGIIFSILYLFEIMIALAKGTEVYTWFWYQILYRNLFIITQILFDVVLILWGVAHIISSRSTGRKGISMGTGIMLGITGNVSLPLAILTPFGAFDPVIRIAYDNANTLLFLASEILATILFFVAQVPAKELE